MKKMVFSVLMVCCASAAVLAQKPSMRNWSLGIGATVGPDGYGARYAPGVCYQLNRHTFGVTALIQSDLNKLSGGDVRWEYALNSYDSACDLQIFAFIKGVWNNGARLSNRMLFQEQLAGTDENVEPRSYRFNSAEAYAGFGLRWRFLKRLEWINAVGLGGYHTFNYPASMYYKGSDSGLELQTLLRVRLGP